MSDPGTKSVGFQLQFFSTSHNPAASTVYYFGVAPFPPTTVASSLYRCHIPRSGVLRWISFAAIVTGGTIGSAENGTINIRVNGATTFTLNTAFKWSDGVTGINQFRNDYLPGMSPLLELAENDYIEFVVTTPAWVTAPTGVLYTVQIWIEQ